MEYLKNLIHGKKCKIIIRIIQKVLGNGVKRMSDKEEKFECDRCGDKFDLEDQASDDRVMGDFCYMCIEEEIAELGEEEAERRQDAYD